MDKEVIYLEFDLSKIYFSSVHPGAVNIFVFEFFFIRAS